MVDPSVTPVALATTTRLNPATVEQVNLAIGTALSGALAGMPLPQPAPEAPGIRRVSWHEFDRFDRYSDGTVKGGALIVVRRPL